METKLAGISNDPRKPNIVKNLIIQNGKLVQRKGYKVFDAGVGGLSEKYPSPLLGEFGVTSKAMSGLSNDKSLTIIFKAKNEFYSGQNRTETIIEIVGVGTTQYLTYLDGILNFVNNEGTGKDISSYLNQDGYDILHNNSIDFSINGNKVNISNSDDPNSFIAYSNLIIYAVYQGLSDSDITNLMDGTKRLEDYNSYRVDTPSIPSADIYAADTAGDYKFFLSSGDQLYVYKNDIYQFTSDISSMITCTNKELHFKVINTFDKIYLQIYDAVFVFDPALNTVVRIHEEPPITPSLVLTTVSFLEAKTYYYSIQGYSNGSYSPLSTSEIQINIPTGEYYGVKFPISMFDFSNYETIIIYRRNVEEASGDQLKVGEVSYTDTEDFIDTMPDKDRGAGVQTTSADYRLPIEPTYISNTIENNGTGIDADIIYYELCYYYDDGTTKYYGVPTPAYRYDLSYLINYKIGTFEIWIYKHKTLDTWTKVYIIRTTIHDGVKKQDVLLDAIDVSASGWGPYNDTYDHYHYTDSHIYNDSGDGTYSRNLPTTLPTPEVTNFEDNIVLKQLDLQQEEYSYKLTYYDLADTTKETDGSDEASLKVTKAGKGITLTWANKKEHGVKIYRSQNGGGYKLVTTIANNYTTTYTDQINYDDLGDIIPSINTFIDSTAISDIEMYNDRLYLISGNNLYWTGVNDITTFEHNNKTLADTPISLFTDNKYLYINADNSVYFMVGYLDEELYITSSDNVTGIYASNNNDTLKIQGDKMVLNGRPIENILIDKEYTIHAYLDYFLFDTGDYYFYLLDQRGNWVMWTKYAETGYIAKYLFTDKNKLVYEYYYENGNDSYLVPEHIVSYKNNIAGVDMAILRRLQAIFKGSKIKVSIVSDTGNRQSRTLSAVKQPLWDTAVWDQDYFPGDTETIFKRFKVRGHSFNIKVELYSGIEFMGLSTQDEKIRRKYE